MKKTLLKIGGVIMTLAFAFIAVQCADKNEKENAGKKVAVAEKKEAVLPNYRYVDGDSVLAAYILAKDYNEEMLFPNYKPSIGKLVMAKRLIKASDNFMLFLSLIVFYFF